MKKNPIIKGLPAQKFLMIIFVLVLFLVMNIRTTQALETNEQAPLKKRYVLVLHTELFRYYMDTETIRYINDPFKIEKLIEVWLQVVATATGKDLEIESREKNKQGTFGYEKFSYSMQCYYLRVNKRQMQRMYQEDFTDDGFSLNKYKNSYDVNAWEDVVPNTVAEKWFNAAVDYLVNTKK